ncbi:ABC transporter substrate-binding protein [Klenkia sp. LSe6-5]|uniref:ABC transporter substrate-binding protein n=1 Tax=Klenkia sesuvii TaxID=3103137 RepID=A0ABU8DUS0_9ACTN
MTRRALPAALFATLAAALSLTACSGGDADPAPGAAGSSTDAVTVQNCGRDVVFDSPPQRIVSGWPTSTELLLELGLGDRLVGQYNTASSQGDPLPQYAEAYAAVPVLSDAAPTRETLLAAAPDLIWADGSYLFDGQQLPTIDELAAQGTQVLVLSGFCDDGGTSAVTDVDDDLDTLGAALGVTDQTDALRDQVDGQLADIEASTADLAPVDAAVISTYEGTVYTYEGVYSDMLERAGGANVLAGTLPEGTYFGELSAEQLLATDPSALVYLLSGDETPEAARALLQQDFPSLSAVAADRLVFLPQIDSTNLRVVDGVQSLADQLAQLR